MQRSSHHHKHNIGGRLQTLSVQSKTKGTNRGLRRTCMVSSSSPRARVQSCTCTNRPGLNRCSRHGYAVPGAEKWRRNYANKEVLRRALTSTPNRSLSLRWWNFQPTPSRLSNMSMA
ncbi:uncharacterized protein LOC110752728 [Prunus avium]|uniref:Uncharacterized protein LOC110752728 n=1 Tax=Prunus avium TaxID=42229 RepID=A0A6P5S6E2_PRUAV|nr:uncharacterized protein LOC110752728 [Prunus avium]